MAQEWTNWSGSLRFKPGKTEKPHTPQEVMQLVSRAIKQKQNIRAVGSGHSSVPLVETNDVLVSLDNMAGIVSHNEATKQVTFKAGTGIEAAGKHLIKLGLSMHNTGDVDYQTLAGAFGTGTHGSGITLQNLPGMLKGFKVVNGLGELKEYTLAHHPGVLMAARVALGALGVITEVTLQAQPARWFVRREYCTHIDTCLANLDELIAENRMFDFYWYPRSDLAKLRTCNPEGEGMQQIPYAKQVKENAGWLYEILPQSRELKFDEMEYAIPLEAGPDCFKEVRQRVKAKHRSYVAWRILCRTVAADEVYLSPFYGRDSMTIAILQNNTLEYKKYFEDIEPILRAYGGRPHWGKKHTLQAKDLSQLYPKWNEFLQIRKQFDPDGIFLNSYLKELLGI